MAWTGGAGGAGPRGRDPARGLRSSDSSASVLLSRSRSCSTAARRSASPPHCASRNAARCGGSRSTAPWKRSSTRWGEGSGISLLNHKELEGHKESADQALNAVLEDEDTLVLLLCVLCVLCGSPLFQPSRFSSQ